MPIALLVKVAISAAVLFKNTNFCTYLRTSTDAFCHMVTMKMLILKTMKDKKYFLVVLFLFVDRMIKSEISVYDD